MIDAMIPPLIPALIPALIAVTTTSVDSVILGVLALAATIVVVRIVRPGSLGDRAVALDTLAAVITCGLLVAAGRSKDGLQLDLAVVLGLLGFLTSVTVARFIESRRGRSQ
ncbi:MAG: monovalent cation/H+ antiporter complex subunit F [Ilumatobacteraceae bacterium]